MTTTSPTKPALDARREHERKKYVALASRPAAPGAGYGSTNHGAAAIPLVQRLKPRLVVDFGCGRNDFIGALRRLGMDGLGVDFAFPEADILRAMHKTGLLDGVADVVTSFDALEHLLPEDVDAVLEEMRRVGRPRAHFVFSICTRPSRTTVAGEGLHPTVRPLAWWLDRISRVGTVMAPIADSRYIAGRFRRCP
ncbi:MAG: class I SAM-dependent methyltransferase [Phycisphaeraceae bacterium]|jgi:SAM-dependent methyltransferase|nr:MAG: class I SAM-dependent methyltransferase [Phycisphaeraceae bacterium]